jgi:hypothetical protein|uniref:Rho termination factor N-terminal domain-containing protein n=1 Tax=viral metagenome TaxID=1070528 RepID=A0A6C0HFG8_9ZZZZ
MVTDSVVIGIVLGLIFAAVSYYLFSRIGQLEHKIGLMENILLDLKVTTEQTIMSMTEPQTSHFSSEESKESEIHNSHDDSRDVILESKKESRSSSSGQQVSVERESSQQKVSVNYESMTYKELVQLAKNKNISGTRNLSKSQVIDLIRRHDSGDATESTMVVDEINHQVSNEGTNVVELLAAQPSSAGTPLDSSEIDSSLVQ